MARSQESRPFLPIREELEFESEEQLSIRTSFNSCLLNQRTKRRVAFVLTAAAFVAILSGLLLVLLFFSKSQGIRTDLIRGKPTYESDDQSWCHTR